jgi:LCP family protein required for cell wall assembly
MADGRQSAGRGRSKKDDAAKKAALANEQRLLALGDAVDQRSGITTKKRKVKRPGHRRRVAIISSVVVLGLLVALLGGGYLYAQYRFNKIPKINVTTEKNRVPGQPFNILEIGSDSRAGLTGAVAKQTGASTGSVAGQRSDVVKIMHVDPSAGTITILSIPRDTMTTLLANTSLYGKFNRINVNYGSGPSLLVQTISANFGIVINHVIQVSFGGLINAADAIGGVYLDFPYPAKDAYSGLKITHAGCQLVTGFQALAVARSRHYQYFQNGQWYSDGTSDFGRIDRQNAFLRAMISKIKGLGILNPIAFNNFLSQIPQGITIDSHFSLGELIGLALRFHGFNPAAMKTYTLPTTSSVDPAVGDVLFVAQPLAQQLLVNIFGSQLIAPTNPPPNSSLQTPMPPPVAPTTTTTVAKSATTVKRTGTTVKRTTPVTTTTNPTNVVPYFDPTPCTP